MNPYTKAAQFIIRLVAFAFVLFGALSLGAEFFARRQEKANSSFLWLFLEVFSFLVGIVLLLKSRDLARKLTEKLED